MVPMATRRVLLRSGDDSLDGPDDDLAQRVDEGLQHVAGVQGAQHPAPEEQAVDELPVVHRLVGVLLNAHTHSMVTPIPRRGNNMEGDCVEQG